MSTQNRMPKSFNAVPKPFNFQSTQQSPSFIKAVKPPSANPSVHHQSPVTSPSPISNVSPAPRAAPSPAARSQPVPQQPQAAQPAQGNGGDYHDLRNPQKSGVMRLPTVNFNQKPLGPTKPIDKKANALSNLSGFMNKQSGGAVARGTLGSPEFLQPLVDREFPIGEPAVLEVRIAGSAPLTVQWYHNSQPVRESIEKDIRLLQKGNVYTLVYGEFSHALLGRYTCQASNQKGTVTTSCVVTEGGYSDDDLEQYPTAKVITLANSL